MPELLPMFPLELVVFPNEDLNLHIFEPRYQELIRDCENKKITFGIPAYIGGELMPIGTEIRLKKVVKRYQGGESDIRTQGVGIFAIRKYYDQFPGKLYAGAEVDRLPLDTAEMPYMNEQIIKKTLELFELLDIDKEFDEDNARFSIFDIAHHVGLTIEQEYELLEIANAHERQEYLLDHLSRLLPVVRHMEEIREKAKMNGHFRKIIPPK
jgi:hypothetical protein